MANTMAYGFVGLESLAAERVNTVGVQVIWDAINQTAAEWNRWSNALMSSWVERTTIAKERRKLPGSGTLQPMDEWGNPLPTQQAGYYDVAYPIQGGATAWGDNRISRSLMTVEEANRQTIEALRMDQDWMRRHLLASVFDNVAWTYTDKIGPTDLQRTSSYTRALRDQCPHDARPDDQMPEPLDVYRRVLAVQPDRSHSRFTASTAPKAITVASSTPKRAISWPSSPRSFTQ